MNLNLSYRSFLLMSLTLAVILSILFIISSVYLTQTTFQRNNGKIAFNSDRDGNFEIYVMNANGSNVARLTNNSDYDIEPWWSPDGSRIAFSSDKDGETKIHGNFSIHREGNLMIYVMDADGSNVTKLTASSGQDCISDW